MPFTVLSFVARRGGEKQARSTPITSQARGRGIVWERALKEGLYLSGEDGAEFVLPIAAMRLGLVKDLEAEDMVH